MRNQLLVCSVAIIVAIASSAQADSLRASANYAVQFDVLASGGGASSSTSYVQPQAVIGQPVIWNTYTSTGYRYQPVGTFLFGNQSSVWSWLTY